MNNSSSEAMKYTCPVDFLSLFSCPNCKSSGLTPVCSGPNSDSFEELQCEACKAEFPLIGGIPRLVDQDNYTGSFGYQWNIHRKTQLDSYCGLPISRDRLYAITKWSGESMKGQRVLEAGSGAGRFTEVLVSTGADIFSFDYSRAVDANACNNGSAENLALFQGNIFNIPFPNIFFDHVLCLGVIQHTPDPEAAFVSLANKVKPGGHLYIDVYTRSWHHMLQWKYILRPLFKRMDMKRLYRLVERMVTVFLPLTKLLKKLFGRLGARLMPIVEYSNIGLDPELNKEWAVLDTFDMYSPAHDHPQSLETVQRWFSEAGFFEVEVWFGANGVVGRGRKPE